MILTKQVLVVDDNATMRQLLQMHLKSAGYTVRAAADAGEAGEAVRERAPDLIIADVYMGATNGFEMIEELKASGAIGEIPVLFLTIDEGGYDRAKALGAVEYLRKPIVAAELLKKVAKHLPA